MRFPLRKFKDRLREDTVRPREPAARIIVEIVDVNCFVDQAEKTGVADHVDGLGDFVIVVGCAGADEDGHGPGVFGADWRGRGED